MNNLNEKQLQYVAAVLKKLNGVVGNDAFIQMQISPMDCGMGWTDSDCADAYKSLLDAKAITFYASSGYAIVEPWSRQQALDYIHKVKRKDDWRAFGKPTTIAVISLVVAVISLIVAVIALKH